MASLLNDYKIIVCAGTGGVGKTTMSASLALLAAQEGKKALVLTIDPARRLAVALGLSEADEYVKVPTQGIKGELWASMIQPEKVFADFVRNTAPDSKLAQRLLDNPLYKQMATNLSGSQEFTSLEKVLSALESAQFDILILDTPPTQHALDFLRAPQKIFNLFQESVTKWFIAGKNEPKFMEKIFQRGTQLALTALQKVTGAKFIHELSDFFEAASALQIKVRERSIKLHRMLSSPETGFLLVTVPDEAKLKEALDFHRTLESEGHRLSAVLVNRSFPNWTLDTQALNEREAKAATDFYASMQAFSLAKRQAYANLNLEMGTHVKIIEIPELNEKLTGLHALREVSQHLRSLISVGGGPDGLR